MIRSAGTRSAAPAVAFVITMVAAVVTLWGCAEREASRGGTALTEPRGPVEARASVDRAVATTGDVLTFQITIDHDPAYAVEIPEAGARIQGFRIVDTEREERTEADGRLVRELIYRLRADLVGSYILPSVSVAFRPAGAAEGEIEGVIETSEIFVEVESVLPEDGSAEDILDIKPLRPIETGRPWWVAAAILGGLAVAALAIWLYLRKRRRPVFAPPEPAHEVAFRTLDALRGTDFADRAAVRRFYFAISETIRAYVEGRFGLNATDLTTEEILAELPALAALSDRDRDLLTSFLAHTDQVKFAEHEATEEEIQGTYEGALGFVESTQPRPEPAASDQELAA